MTTTDTKEEYEICRIFVSKKRGRRTTFRFIGRSYKGRPASVEFSWKRVMRREEKYRDVAGFYHTHPRFSPAPSERDIKTMHAWVIAFGKPMLCAIRSGSIWGFYLFSEKGYRKIRVLKQGKRFIWRR